MNQSTVFGVGVNDSDYITQKFSGGRKNLKLEWTCPIFTKWKSMLCRCKYKPYKDNFKTYEDASVADEWLTFSNFKQWIDSFEIEDIQNYELDKDILVSGNKLYSKDTCCLVDKVTNRFILKKTVRKLDLPTGVSPVRKSSKFQARVSNPFTGKDEYLGCFSLAMDAHKAWKNRKHQLACQLADLQKDVRVANALRTRYL